MIGRWLTFPPASERLDIWRLPRDAEGARDEPERLPDPVNPAESKVF